MLTYTDLPILPTQVIGSHGLPSWMWVIRDAVAEGKLGPSDINETLRDADALQLEFANRCMWESDLWAEFGGDKILCAGVIDVKGRSVETPEIVADRIRTLLKSVRPEKLWLAPDCGFSQTARWLAVEKLKSLVEAARIVRRELAA